MPRLKPTRGADERWCSRCKSFVPLSGFGVHIRRTRNRTSQLTEWCKECKRQYQIGYRDRLEEVRQHHRTTGGLRFWGEKLRHIRTGCSQAEIQQKYFEDPRCYYCRVPLTPTETHIDHMTPLSKGGALTIDNLVIACGDCNRMKFTRTADEFFAFLQDYAIRLANRAQANPSLGKQRERLSEETPFKIVS